MGHNCGLFFTYMANKDMVRSLKTVYRIDCSKKLFHLDVGKRRVNKERIEKFLDKKWREKVKLTITIQVGKSLVTIKEKKGTPPFLKLHCQGRHAQKKGLFKLERDCGQTLTGRLVKEELLKPDLFAGRSHQRIKPEGLRLGLLANGT